MIEAKLAAAVPPASRAASQWWPILLIVLPLAAVDFAVAPLMRKIAPNEPASVLVYACMGLIPAQAGLLSLGLVFGSGTFIRRLLVHWFSVLFLVVVWVNGFWLGHDRVLSRGNWEDAIRGICVLPLIALATQAPLWLARLALGWRLVGDCPIRIRLSIAGLLAALAVVGAVFAVSRLASIEDRRDMEFQFTVFVLAAGLGIAANNLFVFGSRGQRDLDAENLCSANVPATQVTIRDLLIATAVIALSLGIARAAPLGPYLQENPQTLWTAVALFAAGSAGASLLAVLPLLLIFAKMPLPFAWLTTIAYASLYWLGFILLAASGILGLPLLETQKMIGLATTIGGLACGIAAGLTALRLNGVELKGMSSTRHHLDP